MKQYETNKIKNVAIIGHGGAGKTSLCEAMIFKAGLSDRLGKVEEGNTIFDFEQEEIKRKVSIGVALASFEHNERKINLLDAPGLFDFTTGFHEALRACDTALITVSGKSGVNVGTKKAYALAKKMNKATMIFVSKMDRPSADFYKVFEQLKSTFGPTIFPIVVPYTQDKEIECYINLIDMKAYKYIDSKAVEVELPKTEHRLEGLIGAISEAVAETDEKLFEKYFSGEEFSKQELVEGIRNGVKKGDITPIYCGSSLTLDGIDMLLDGMSRLLPSARKTHETVRCNNEMVDMEVDPDKETTAIVFKTVADPFVGRMSYIKVLSGAVESGMELVNASTGETEKVGKLLSVFGKKQEDIKKIIAGDIGVASKLIAKTGDTLCAGQIVQAAASNFDEACYSMAIIPKAKGDEAKISTAIAKLLDEDMSLKFSINTETHQQIISGLGEQHLDVVVSKLANKFGVEVELMPPIVAYRETIRKKVSVQGKHKKQSGGHGQFGDVWIEFEPSDCDGLEFCQRVVGGAVPRSYFPAVEKGLLECAKHGTLAGYPVVGVKATLYDGSYHPVDSSEMSFKMAATQAYKAGIPQASPTVLEPIGRLFVIVPESSAGDMLGELNKKRGRVLGMHPADEGFSNIEADVPMSDMHDFAILLRQMTQGSGSFTFKFDRYEQLPNQLVAQVIEKAALINMEE
ncbi:MAG: elongation factor G [Oscillospiraceae bacterium]